MNLQDPAKLFREFPLSVRISQRCWITALAIPLFSFKVLAKMKIPWVVQTILGAAGIFALVGFLATSWVVARYPYIGMVDAADGDLYSRYIEKTSTFLKKLLGLLLAIGLGLSLFAPMRDGNITGAELLWLSYGGCTLVFVLFVLLRYNRFDHPAVATLLRCSMGLGILLFPLFLPAIIIGSSRAKRLLSQAQEELTS
jgi:hypothetical protein